MASPIDLNGPAAAAALQIASSIMDQFDPLTNKSTFAKKPTPQETADYTTSRCGTIGALAGTILAGLYGGKFESHQKPDAHK
jgi:hypothetical protein